MGRCRLRSNGNRRRRHGRELLWCAASTVDQAWQITGLLSVPWLLSDAELLPTGVVGIGPAVAPVLAD